MTRPFAWVSVPLAGAVGMLVGAIMTGSAASPPQVSGPPAVAAAPSVPVAVVPAGAMAADFADVVDEVNPAVVSVDATAGAGRRGTAEPAPDSGSGWRRSERPRRGAGTGVIMDAGGVIITNHHVVDAADRITVKLADGRSFPARLLGADADTDIAVLKIEAPGPLPQVRFGDSAALRVGEWVCAIGNPLAYDHTVTVGVVSYLGRKLFAQSVDQYIQTDAAISFGNSGGPLLNAAGDVVGINTAVSRQANNIGFAIPINQVKAILPQLLSSGRVTRGYLGVALRDVDTDLQDALGLGPVTGAFVEDVTPGSPAERAGLRAYDVITAINGVAVDGDEMVLKAVAGIQPGATMRVEFSRDGRRHSQLLKVAERPSPAGARAASATRPGSTPRPVDLGLTLIEVHAGNAARYDVPPGLTGLLVQRVEPLSAAADAGIARGQLILDINRRPVTTVAALRQAATLGRPGRPIAVLTYDPDIDQRVLRLVPAETP